MELVKSIIILVIGFALLMKGADYFVEGSSSVAKRLYIPSMIIGMTIVAMGTSLPECAVSVTAVSYTHLDVYKRQVWCVCKSLSRRSTSHGRWKNCHR